MTSDEQGRQTVPTREDGPAEQAGGRRPRRLYLILLVIAAVIALLVVPPLISIGRYKSRITQVISQSFGRPVRLASVELRLLPWPGFVLTDLSVDEDPAYGSEPVLHADSVQANIRLLSLWRGKLEISSVSVDDASLNVVRATPGHWNLDPIFRTAAAKAGPDAKGQAHRFPYLEATNSRINFKDGVEKLPFSLVDTDLSLWQESPGEWRLRLRGQPARTDVALDLGDTGIVRLEASVHRAPELQQMPLHVDIDWRQAQLGQLSRLLIGYDPGWRGDLTGELHLEGTPNAANVTTRLRATGVHRAEFAPASPLDFDANCGFVYHYSKRALDNLVCNSPLGDGRLRLTGDKSGVDAAPNLTVELDHISAGAGLDVLRTLRSGINPDLEAEGTISGKLVYKGPGEQGTEGPERQGPRGRGNKGAGNTRRGRARTVVQGPLTGSLTVEGFALSGGGLSQPLRVPKMVLEPAVVGAAPGNGSQGPEALTGTMEIAAGGPAPLAVNVKLALYGYEAAIHGQASIARARELGQMAGTGPMLDNLAGEALTASLIAEGPWTASEIVPEAIPPSVAPAVSPSVFPAVLTGAVAAAPAAAPSAHRPAGPEPTEFDRGIKPAEDRITGTIQLRNANWHADYLENHVELTEATLHLGGSALRWDPVVFAYGPVKGTASVTWPLNCADAAPQGCAAHFQAQFGALDASTVEAAFLGAHQKSTLLSDLIDRLHPASAPLWPAMEGTITADSLALGPMTLAKASATVRIEDDHADVSGLTGNILGGQVQASGTVRWPAGDQAGPSYAAEAHFDAVSAAALGQLLAVRWSGGPVTAHGKIDLSGFTGKDLAGSAKGTLQFDWQHGGVAGVKPLAHFGEWSGDAAIADGGVTLGENQLVAAGRKLAVEGAVTFGKPSKVQFVVAKLPAAKRAGSATGESATKR